MTLQRRKKNEKFESCYDVQRQKFERCSIVLAITSILSWTNICCPIKSFFNQKAEESYKEKTKTLRVKNIIYMALQLKDVGKKINFYKFQLKTHFYTLKKINTRKGKLYII